MLTVLPGGPWQALGVELWGGQGLQPGVEAEAWETASYTQLLFKFAALLGESHKDGENTNHKSS